MAARNLSFGLEILKPKEIPNAFLKNTNNRKRQIEITRQSNRRTEYFLKTNIKTRGKGEKKKVKLEVRQE